MISLHPVFEGFSTASVGATVQRHFVTENRKKRFERNQKLGITLNFLWHHVPYQYEFDCFILLTQINTNISRIIVMAFASN